MASYLMNFKVFLIFIIYLFFINSLKIESFEFDVGGEQGWTTPKPEQAQMYNDWASKNRFQVNDTLRFRYKKDSVLVVAHEEYEKCQSSHPSFFSNNGDTSFTLDRSGLFYFISGLAGHCQRGLKMAVKVLEIESPPPQVADQTSHGPPSSNSATGYAAVSTTLACFMATLYSLFWFL